MMDEIFLQLDELQLCNNILDFAREYYSDPKHLRAYEIWAAEKNRKCPAGREPAGRKEKKDRQQIIL